MSCNLVTFWKSTVEKIPWGGPVEIEIRNRIRLAIYAYAYEFESDSIITDGEFDNLAKNINLSVSTGDKKLDKFFRMEFDEFTGIWIRKHPELKKIKRLYRKYYSF